MKTVEEAFAFLSEYEYRTEPTYGEDIIAEFEKQNGFSFPEQYRWFLLNIGSGLIIDGQYGELYIGGKILNHRGKIAANSNLHKEFLLDEPYGVDSDGRRVYCGFYNHYTDCVADENSEDGVCEGCPHQDNCIDEWLDDDADLDYSAFWHGSYIIAYAGCTYTYQLVLNGKHRGEVWIFDETDRAVPVTPDFASFVERVCRMKTY